MNPLVVRSTVVAALGGLLFGFDTAVISGTTQDLERVFGLSDFALGFTVASALIGTIIGAFSAGRPVDTYGRKKVLFAIALLYLVSAIGSAAATDWYVFLFFRFIGGLGVGAASVTSPIYSAEVSPPRIRGRLVGLVQLNIVVGILLAYISNAAVDALVEGQTAWRWMFAVEAAPAVLFLLLLFTVPETPRWLFGNGREEEGRQVIARITGSRDEAEALSTEITDSLHHEENAPDVPFFTEGHRKVILLAFAIAMFNQLSGINAVLYYAPDIFRMAGAGTSSAFLQSVAVGGMNLVATVAALVVIDMVGRRRLMLVGSIGYLVSLGWLSLQFFTAGEDGAGPTVLVGLLVFIAAHAFGQGAVIWVFISEIFPNRIRGRGQAWGSFTHWFFAALVSWTFPWIANGLGGGAAFLIFGLFMVGQLVWVLRVMPETKGFALEDMERELGLVGAASRR